jgi:photosystem II stability/assembly factor-like uncharacterized protein
MRAGFLILACSLLISSDAGAAPPSPYVPQSVAFWDGQNGIATFLSCGHWSCLGRVETTTDGGRTWHLRLQAPRLGDVFVVRGTRDAWVSSPRGYLHSTDRGLLWARVPETQGLIDLALPTRRSGYGLRWRKYKIALVTTRNTGRTWKRLPLPCSRLVTQTGILSFPTAKRGWLFCIGTSGTGWQSKELYETRNGGKAWRRRPWGGDRFSPGYANGMNFLRSGTGLLWQQRASTYRTPDGGRHWSRLPTTMPELREGLSGWLVSGRMSYLLVQDNRKADVELLRSGDGGRTWRRVRSWSRR